MRLYAPASIEGGARQSDFFGLLQQAGAFARRTPDGEVCVAPCATLESRWAARATSSQYRKSTSYSSTLPVRVVLRALSRRANIEGANKSELLATDVTDVLGSHGASSNLAEAKIKEDLN